MFYNKIWFWLIILALTAIISSAIIGSADTISIVCILILVGMVMYWMGQE